MNYKKCVYAFIISNIALVGTTTFPLEKVSSNEYRTYYWHNGAEIVVLNHASLTNPEAIKGLDCIVNAANKLLKHDGGLSAAIAQHAGPELQQISDQIVAESHIDHIHPGQAVATPPFKYQADGIKKIVHTVGPNTTIASEKKDMKSLLQWSYLWAIDRATMAETLTLKNKSISLPACSRIGFPAISTGSFGYDIREATPIAIKTILEFIDKNPGKIKEIRFFLTGDHSDRDYGVYIQTLDAYK